jgi:hypothetical protein
MKVCQNCQSQITCGCQIRRASDGTDCCSQCLIQVEARIQGNVPQVAQPVQVPYGTGPLDPTIVSVTYNQKQID